MISKISKDNSLQTETERFLADWDRLRRAGYNGYYIVQDQKYHTWQAWTEYRHRPSGELRRRLSFSEDSLAKLFSALKGKPPGLPVLSADHVVLNCSEWLPYRKNEP